MRKQIEDLPSNSKHVQKKTRAQQKVRLPVAMRDEREEELAAEGQELAEKGLLKANIIRPRVRKKGFLQRISEAIFGSGTENVGQYILSDVLVPAAKTTIQDMVTSGIEMLLFGETTGRRRSHRDGGKRSYGSYFNMSRDRYGSRDDYRRHEVRRVPGYHNRLDDISFEGRDDANLVLEMLEERLEEYGQVSIADFYEIAGLEAISEFTDHGWGWTNLSRAQVVRTKAGYEIDFPKPKELEE